MGSRSERVLAQTDQPNIIRSEARSRGATQGTKFARHARKRSQSLLEKNPLINKYLCWRIPSEEYLPKNTFVGNTFAGIPLLKNTLARYTFKRGFWGSLIPRIWATLPQSLVAEGDQRGWLRIKSKCIKFITHGLITQAKPCSSLRAHAPVFLPTAKNSKLLWRKASHELEWLLFIDISKSATMA